VDRYRHVPIAGLIQRIHRGWLVKLVNPASYYGLSVSTRMRIRLVEIIASRDRNSIRHCMPRRLSRAAHRPALYLARCGLLDHNYHRVSRRHVAALISMLIFLRFRDLLWPHPPYSRSIPAFAPGFAANCRHRP